jgi:hypothetical protein
MYQKWCLSLHIRWQLILTNLNQYNMFIFIHFHWEFYIPISVNSRKVKGSYCMPKNVHSEANTYYALLRKMPKTVTKLLLTHSTKHFGTERRIKGRQNKVHRVFTYFIGLFSLQRLSNSRYAGSMWPASWLFTNSNSPMAFLLFETEFG